MRSLSLKLALVVIVPFPCPSSALPPQSNPASQLVREVVYNELSDHQAHGFWRYWIQRRTPTETRVDEQVETADGPIAQQSLSNGAPLDAQARQQEKDRLRHLLSSPQEQARQRQQYAEDENRIGRILGLLPDAFLYEFAGDENGCHRLAFRPNPDYPARTLEARVFHGMSGTLWVDARHKRLVRLDGHVAENVDLAYGILGRLNKGGWFQLQRTQVSPTEWKTQRLEIHLTGRALIKSFANQTSELRGGFAPVPSGLNLAQGMALLERSEAQTILPNRSPRIDAPSHLAPAALAFSR
jgi:hypothetical protein